MVVSTRGRYALRVMIDIAENQEEGKYIALKAIVERQGISQKYIESIMTELSKGGFLDAVHGKGGGYRLNRKPEDYKVSEILKVTEGEICPVSCPVCTGSTCPKSEGCRTLPMWQALYKEINEFFDSYTIANLMKK